MRSQRRFVLFGTPLQAVTMPSDYDLSQYLNIVFAQYSGEIAGMVAALSILLLFYVFFRDVLRFGEKPREPE
jgi:hypothetical protein